MAGQFNYDIFLSHNRRDRERVREIAERLRAGGLRVRFDQTGDRTAAQMVMGA